MLYYSAQGLLKAVFVLGMGVGAEIRYPRLESVEGPWK